MDLQAILALLGEEGTNEEKADKIIALHKTANEPLGRAKEKILAEKKELQAKYDKLAGDVETEKETAETKIKELEEQIARNSPEDLKKANEAQIERLNAKYEAEKKKLAAELEESKNSHNTLLERRRKDLVGLALENAITKSGITDPNNRELARKAFLFDHGSAFSPNDEEIPVNTDHHTVAEVFEKLVASESSYQNLIPARNSGGGATGSAGTKPPTANPFIKGKENLTEQGRLFKENPAKFQQLKEEAANASA